MDISILKTKKFVLFLLETILYIICCIFLLAILSFMLYMAYILLLENQVLRYYAFGAAFAVLAFLSMVYVIKYNKKYIKNDSDSSKRQNDLLFDSDLYGKKGGDSNRRDVE